MKKIILAVAIIIISIITYNLVIQIMDAVKSGERLSQAAEKVYKLEAKNRELKKKLAQIQSEGFIEKEARNKLGLSKIGETIVVIPQERLKQVMGVSQSAQIKLPNWLGWWKVFF
ncbi:septum formation initiator family protein [Candidatus Daviesbacteria bacterium]|nr:septum formation initiator family protein [Candidatus Daviesbacteria bacterium]